MKLQTAALPAACWQESKQLLLLEAELLNGV
jgi:hypothetical protein